MEQIASDGRRTVFLRMMAPDDALDSPFGGELYPVLVWATVDTSAEYKQRLCESLVATGCRYVVCGGAECWVWEHAADRAYIEQELPEPVPDEQFVMTTSHRNEPPDEVAFFFVHNTSFGEHDFTRYLVLMIGEDERVREALNAAVRHELEAAR
jgi:hypothetical protein